LVETITYAIANAAWNMGMGLSDIMDRLDLLAKYVNISFLAVNLFTNLLIPFMIGMSHMVLLVLMY
jgi:hypothetical protein